MSTFNSDLIIRKDFFEIFTQMSVLRITSDNFLKNLSIFLKNEQDSMTNIDNLSQDARADLDNVSQDIEIMHNAIFSKKVKYFFLKNFAPKKGIDIIPNILFLKNFFQFSQDLEYGQEHSFLKEIPSFTKSKRLNKITKQKKFFRKFFLKKFAYLQFSSKFFLKKFFKKSIFPKLINHCQLDLPDNSFLSRYFIFKNWGKRKRKKFKLFNLRSYRFIRVSRFKKKRFFNLFKKRIKPLFRYTTSNSRYSFFKKNFFEKSGSFALEDFKISSFFIKNFFLKNIFAYNYKLNSNSSANTLNSYFYNCFFKYSSQKDSFEVTNYTPFISLETHLKNKVVSKVNVNYVPNFYRYVYYTLANFIEVFSKKRFFLKIFSKSKSNNDVLHHIDSIFFKNRSLQNKIGRGFFLHEMLDIIYVTFFYKDLNFLIKWFVKTMYRISFLNHKKFISSFKFLLLKHSKFFIKDNAVNGFFFDIRGKVGVTGNAKKRHISFYVGDFSKTFKKCKFDYQFDIVKTHTGSLGITMYLSY